MLKSRVLTAIVLLFIIFAMMWLLSSQVFSIVISIFFIISAIEWTAFIGLKHRLWRIAYLVLVILALCMVYFLPPLLLCYVTLILWLWAAAAVCCYQYGGGLLGFQQGWIKALCGLVMISGCWKSVVLLQAASPLWLLVVFVLIWLVDTGAYFAGRRWGSHALAPRISPKKTWEGFWGGILLAVAVTAVGSFFLPMSPWQRGWFVLLIMVCALFAVAGDLFVSLLKRQAGLKDSSSLLPGHGGLLDRVDSTISTAPVFALGFLLLRLGSY